MTEAAKNRRRFLGVKQYALILGTVWTAVIAGMSAWHLMDFREGTIELARIQANDSFEKDLIYRRWAAKHGGVYVPATKETPPNPYLSHLEERDVLTPSGRRLTLVNPAYMTRQVHELGLKEYGRQGHITSLNPIRKENAPDPWEKRALEAFDKGEKESVSIETLAGKPHLRLMRPLFTETGCLKCHAAQGYQVGDLRGGISVSVPMAPLWAAQKKHMASTATGYGLIWLLGLSGIGIGAKRIGSHVHERNRAEEELAKHRDGLEELVKERTATLHESERNLTVAQAMAHVGHWMLNVETGEVTGSDEFFRIFGLNREDAALESFLEVVHPEDRESYLHHVTRGMEHGENWGTENRLVCMDGTEKTIHTRGEAVIDEGGRAVQLRGIIQDITERKRMETELRKYTERLEELVEKRTSRIQQLEQHRSELAKLAATGRMAAGIAHEINNPLAGIKNSLLVLKDAFPTDDEDYHFFDLILREIERMSEIVHQMYMLYEPKTDGLVAVDIASEVKEVCDMFASEAEQHRLRLQIDIDATSAKFVLPAGHVRQILYNLIANAIDASPAQNEVRVAIKQ